MSLLIPTIAHHLDITDDTLCGLRLNILLFKGGTERLRQLFDSRVSPPNLQQFLKVKEPDIRKTLSKTHYKQVSERQIVPSFTCFP